LDCDGSAHSDLFTDGWLHRVLERANQDAEMVDKARDLSVRILLDTGESRHLMCLNDGSWTLVGQPRPDDSWDVTLRASLASWKKFFDYMPPPRFQSLMALRAGDPTFALDGNRLLAAQVLPVLERMADVARTMDRAEPQKGQKAPSESQVKRDPAQIIGRYVDLPDPSGKPWRIYYEEAGSGVPLLLLHTAGADGRQFHDLLCDVEIAAHWRMLSFDMPFHGRSTPADGWWESPYKLTTEMYAHWCVAFIRAIAQQRAVVMGSSMGGAMSVYLAARHREDVCAAIGLEAPDCSPGRLNRFLTNPQVNQACFIPTYVYGLMSPSSPEELRRRAWWYYSQGGYGVYEGDLNFYSEEWNANKLKSQFDVSQCPVYLLTGVYDYSATPESTLRLADLIPGAQVRTMPELGHFPMTEHPDAFRLHLMPVLDELLKVLPNSRK
jgi:pimeloyl-ACP methyl ester carboxylesterase